MEHYICKLCGTEITDAEGIVSYSNFIDDPRDPLYEYSGSSFHKVCFQTWDKKTVFEKKFQEFIEEARNVHEKITGQKIDATELLKLLFKNKKK